MKNGLKRWVSLFALVLSLFVSFNIWAQVGPQGQDGQWVLWTTLQADQSISKKWNWSSILAYSRHSDPKTFHPFRYFGVFCFRQEMAYQLNPHITVSLGAFYSNIGEDVEPEPHPAYLNEIRVYPRAYYHVKRKKWRFSAQFRTDFRYFSGPRLAQYEEPFEIRNRASVRFFLPLSSSEKVTLILNTELLAATRFNNTDGSWSDYALTENRTFLFCRFKLNEHLLLDVGEMTQFRLSSRQFSEYFALGLIVKNPFQWAKR